MDRIERTTNLIKKYNKYLKNESYRSEFIKCLCDYYDFMNGEEKISNKDKQFLYFMANKAGIPHYFYMLDKNNTDEINEKCERNIDLQTFASIANESSLIIGDDKLHKYQKNVLDLFKFETDNRFVLSAPTSFGKTFLIYKIIERMKYNNIILIFPTISLLSENYEKLINISRKNEFFKRYFIHTMADDDVEKYNIWILTPERYLSMLDKQNNFLKVDFIFVDEIYKIDNGYFTNEQDECEDERDIAYRIALNYACKNANDILLVGPYMNLINKSYLHNECSFETFMKKNKIKILDYNDIEIVNKKIIQIKNKKRYLIDNNICLKFDKSGKKYKVNVIVNELINNNENTIIYCSTKAKVNEYAYYLIEKLDDIDYEQYDILRKFILHLELKFNDSWIVVKALKKGIGIHHGLIPKYIQKQIIDLFNDNILNVLISTTTITEGVNTSAKNIIVLSAKKGIKEINHFDAMNIAGRAGRFSYHYSGRVFVLDDEFSKKYKDEGKMLEHKNYDVNSSKGDVDIFFTDNNFLNDKDKKHKEDMLYRIEECDIPINIIKQFKTISIYDKLELLDDIKKFSKDDFKKINKMIIDIQHRGILNIEGFQSVINCVRPIIHNKDIQNLIDRKWSSDDRYSVLTAQVKTYIEKGFNGVLNYNINNKDNIDKAIMETSKTVFHTFKYSLVKYLGVFNLIYSYLYRDEQKDISILITLLEYGTISNTGKKLSDYGVPFNILSFYDKNNEVDEFNFDDYEKYILNKIKYILNE